MKKSLAEFIGTMTLVLIGCGTAVFAGSSVGITGIALAFGLAIVAMAYGIGPVSGCHVNPAVSLGVWAAGRMSTGEMIQYWIAQFLGAIAGAAIIYFIATGKAGYDIATHGLGQNGWNMKFFDGEYNVTSAFIFELVATFLFLVTILGVTQTASTGLVAGLAIGLTLTAIHLLGINITGVSVNPARSAGPALFAGSQAISQLWLFIVAPALGALGAGFLFRSGLLGLRDMDA